MQDAASLSSFILDTLNENELATQMIVSQRYDGTSVIAALEAIYVHCYTHTLRLVLVNTVKAVKSASEIFALLEAVYVFLSSSKAHAVFL